jgi:hypothetical protein
MSKQAKEEIRLTGHTNIVIPSRGLKKISKSSLPPRPSNLRNYLNDKDDPEENIENEE